ncbi:ABC transporter substrate-binding protein [Sphingomonas montana]|uniref:ABC transporter substrate-binding protein n=1 Tax=Sphingomonas montana TaxID=1843236 RepID=UPI00096CBF18|nr:ABC transporter substrate-binding protein [Sphingomonas montana]
MGSDARGPLRGMTWDHPRGYDPLVAATDAWRRQGGRPIQWDRRSLQDFETFPVRSLAETYDMIVIDHPHVGQIVAEDCLVPFGGTGGPGDFVGRSFESYRWAGRQWALPIDAATQVQAYRADGLSAAPEDWGGVMALARAGRVLCPLRSPHALMSLYTLCGLAGHAPAAEGPMLFAPGPAAEAYDRLRRLARIVDPACFDMDPIAVLEAMAAPGATIDLAPLIYGYVNYAAAGFRASPIRFSDLPGDGDGRHGGSALGGTGIAVSRFGQDPATAAAFAMFVAGGDCQKTLYAAAGGQPAHVAAWEDDSVNRATADFYRATRRTLDGAWLRPRHDGAMAFQAAASARLDRALRLDEQGAPLIAALNHLFAESLPA